MLSPRPARPWLLGRPALSAGLRPSRGEAREASASPGALSFSSLAQIKVNILGEVVEKGSSCFPVDTTGFCLHSAVYAARPDVRCIIHLHTPATAAVSVALGPASQSLGPRAKPRRGSTQFSVPTLILSACPSPGVLVRGPQGAARRVLYCPLHPLWHTHRRALAQVLAPLDLALRSEPVG